MTVGELRQKLEIYKDDVEIYCHHYEDMLCQDWYSDPYLHEDTVRAYTSKKGHLIYTRNGHPKDSKQHIVLVIE